MTRAIKGGWVRNGRRLALQEYPDMLHRDGIFCTWQHQEDFARETRKGPSEQRTACGKGWVCVCAHALVDWQETRLRVEAGPGPIRGA